MIADAPSGAGRRPRALPVLLIAAAALWLAIPGIDFRSIENHEHGLFARIAQNILWSGDWIAFADGSGPMRHAPPLLPWLIAALSAPFDHVNAWAARLAPMLASMAAGLAVYGIGHRLAERTVGLLGALLLLSAWRWVWAAHSITPETLVAATVAGVLYCAVRARQSSRRGYWWAGAGVTAGLGILAGGLLALAIVCLLFAAARRVLADKAFRWPALAVAACACALTVGPWAVWLAGRAGWGDVWASVSPGAAAPEVGPVVPVRSAWWALGRLPVGFLPWTALWPGLLVALRSTELPERWGRALWLGLVWALLPLVAVGVSRGAAVPFLLCAYPGWALLCGLLLADVLQRVPSSEGWKAWLGPRVVVAGACVVLALPVLAVAAVVPAVFAPVARVMGLLGGLLALMAVYLLILHHGPARVRVALGIILVASLAVHAAYLRALGVRDPAESPYRWTALHLRALAEGYPLTGSAVFDRRLVFYFDEAPLPSATAVLQRLEAARPVACLVPRTEWSALEPLVEDHVHAAHTVFAVDVPAVLLVSRPPVDERDVAILPKGLGAAQRRLALAAPSRKTP